MDFHFQGMDDLLKKLSQIPLQMDQSLGIAARAMSAIMVNTVRDQFTTTHAKGTPTPSRSGQPPSIVSGTLKNSITPKVMRRGFGDYLIEVGPTVVYGRALELGNPKWKNGARFPYMEPATRLLMEKGTLQRIYTQAIKHGLR